MDLDTFKGKCPPGLACKGLIIHMQNPYKSQSPREKTPIFFYNLTDGPEKEKYLRLWKPEQKVDVVPYVFQTKVDIGIVPEFLIRFPSISQVYPITLDQFLAVATLVGSHTT